MAYNGNQVDDILLPSNSTVVAVDKDKYSPFAVRWAIDHLLNTTHFVILVHVKHRNTQSHHDNDDQLFTPFRGYCARKSVQIKEVILEESDVARGLVNYINKCSITNIVVGASNRSFIKNFKKPDVPTTLSKLAPDFCSVYVIQKGKIVSVRSAVRLLPNNAAPRTQSSTNLDDGNRGSSGPATGVLTSFGSDRYPIDRSPPINEPPGCRESRLHKVFSATNSPKKRSIDNTERQPDDNLGFQSFDISSQYLDFSIPEMNGGSSCSNTKDVEAEMRRLRQELKQTMDMYSNACKEALAAKQKAKELNDWKLEELKRLEQARKAQEAALQLAETEKAKCKAALEAANAAQRTAELASKKRLLAEQKAKREAAEKNRALTQLVSHHHDVRYRRYSIEEIEVATDKFSNELKIGEGGYGPVFKGKLDHTQVAIKVLRPEAAQGRKQFQQEVEVLSCMRHPNMVILLGASPEYGCLVYEYMDNGSLEDRLFRRNNTPPIPWRIRFKIAVEIVTALNFLHQAKPEPLVHRDLKPANILLDQHYVSKISDVGLARLVPPKVADQVTQYHMTSAAGTFCYIDPEYQQTGMLTTRSDVYSLGILLLQIITSRPPMGLSHHVQKAIDRGNFESVLDSSITDWPLQHTLRFAKIALKCAELRKRDRPDLAQVVLPELISLRDYGSDSSP